MHLKKTLFAIVTLALALTAASAFAADKVGSLGFHSSSAPIGIRHWVTDQVGVDLGLGFNTYTTDNTNLLVTPSTKTTNKQSAFTFDIGVPFSVLKWERVRFIARPGFQYRTQKYDYDKNYSSTNYKYTYMYLTGELEAEIMVADNVRVSASHGLSWQSYKVTYTDNTTNKDTQETKQTGIYAFGNGWNSVGFHVYLW